MVYRLDIFSFFFFLLFLSHFPILPWDQYFIGTFTTQPWWTPYPPMEPIPMVESIPMVDPIPMVESIPMVDPIPMVDAMPMVEPIPMVDPITLGSYTTHIDPVHPISIKYLAIAFAAGL